MLSRIPGGNSWARLSWLFFTVLIAQCSLQAVSPHPNRSVIQDWNYLPGCCVFHAVSLPLCSLQALLSFSVQSERDAAEVRLIFALHSAMQASPRAVPTACSSQHTHTHLLLWSGKWNSRIIPWWDLHNRFEMLLSAKVCGGMNWGLCCSLQTALVVMLWFPSTTSASRSFMFSPAQMSFIWTEIMPLKM